MIYIVDYGVGNIQAFLNLFNRLGIDAQRASSADVLTGATHLVLPGVGHFDHAMQMLNNSGMRLRLEELVLGSHVPIVGICVGMHMLASKSDEGVLPGLNWIPGQVKSFSSLPQCADLPLPHMGWNDLHLNKGSKLFANGFDDVPQFYFLHSYYFDAADKRDVVATAQYGIDFDAAVTRAQINGIQCHPEKSHHWGEQFLKNFVGC